MPGHASGSVTHKSARTVPMPCTARASSSAGWAERKVAAVMMNASGASPSPWTKPMPMGDAMLIRQSGNTVAIAAFTRPIRGCSRNTQPIALKNPGIKSPTVMKVKTSPLRGSVVRSTIHATGTPQRSAVNVATAEKIAVLKSVDAMYAAGLVEETRALADRYPREARPFGSIGYAEAVKVLTGELTLEDAAAETRR